MHCNRQIIITSTTLFFHVLHSACKKRNTTYHMYTYILSQNVNAHTHTHAYFTTTALLLNEMHRCIPIEGYHMRGGQFLRHAHTLFLAFNKMRERLYCARSITVCVREIVGKILNKKTFTCTSDSFCVQVEFFILQLG